MFGLANRLRPYTHHFMPKIPDGGCKTGSSFSSVAVTIELIKNVADVTDKISILDTNCNVFEVVRDR